MPKLTVHFNDTGFTNKEEADSFVNQTGASSSRIIKNKALKDYSLDLSFDNVYDGNKLLDEYPNAQGYLEFEDGTISKHFIRRERNFND